MNRSITAMVRCPQWLPVAAVIFLILLAGIGQTHTNIYLNSQLIDKQRTETAQHSLLYQALQDRIELYRQAFIARDYDTMYRLSYFKGIPQPSPAEYRAARDPGHKFDISVTVQDIEMNGSQAVATLELVLKHPALGVNKTNHRQEWELITGQWYKIDYD